MKISSFKELYINELRDLFSAETQLVAVLPRVADSVHSQRLSEAIHAHLGQTMEHAKRLDGIIQGMGVRSDGVKCRAMEGLVRELNEAIHDIEKGPVLDASLIGACRRVEHYEMAGYATTMALARQLGHEDHAVQLASTMEEESAADKTMSELVSSVMSTPVLTTAK